MSNGLVSLKKHVDVLHVVTRDQRRGAETAASYLAADLEAWAPQAVVALAAREPDQPGLGLLSMSQRPGHGPQVVRRSLSLLAMVLRERRPRLVVAHGGQSLMAVVAARRLARVSVPVVWQRILHFPDQLRASRSRRVFWRSLAKQCSGVVALTSQTAHETAELGFVGPIAQIPNHRPWAVYGPDNSDSGDPCSQLGIPAGAPVLGFVGHLVPQKDPCRFAAVGGRVLDSVPSAHALIVGDGPLRAALDVAVSSLPPERTHVYGHADNVLPLLRRIDVLVSVSRTESMTGGLIEALMAGCAVVTVDVDGMADLILPSVGAVAKEDEGLVAAAVPLLSDRNLLAETKAAAASWGETFSTERIAEQYRSFFEQVIQDSETGPGP